MNDELFKPSCDHSRRLTFLCRFQKNKYVRLIRVGVKHPSKTDVEGLFGDKRLLNAPFCSGSGEHSLQLTVKLKVQLFLLHPSGVALLPQSTSLFLFPIHRKWQPLPQVSSTPPPSLFRSPCLSFRSEGRGGI